MHHNSDYENEFIMKAYTYVKPIIKELHENEVIPHSVWFECVQFLNSLQSDLNLQLDTRFIIPYIIKEMGGPPVTEIINRLQFFSTRHYIHSVECLIKGYRIMHMGIMEKNNKSLTCTCCSNISFDSVLFNLPLCCQESIYQQSKKLKNGQFAKLFFGHESEPTHAHSVGKEDGRIVISEVNASQLISPVILSQDSPIERAEKISQYLLYKSGFVDSNKIIQFKGCPRFYSISNYSSMIH